MYVPVTPSACRKIERADKNGSVATAPTKRQGLGVSVAYPHGREHKGGSGDEQNSSDAPDQVALKLGVRGLLIKGLAEAGWIKNSEIGSKM